MSWDGDQGGVPALMDDVSGVFPPEIREGEPALMISVSGVFPLLRMRTVYWEQRLTGCLIFIKVCRNGSRLQNKGRLFNCYALFRSLKEITLLYSLLHVVLY